MKDDRFETFVIVPSLDSMHEVKLIMIWLWQLAVRIRKSCNLIGTSVLEYFPYCPLSGGNLRKALLVSNKDLNF